MAVDAIGGVVGGGVQDLQRSGVNQDDFLKIFLSQLSFQDPLEPVDNREFLAQLAQFSAVEQQRQTNENVEGLLNVQAATQAIGLLGRTVQVDSAAGQTVGQVTTLNFQSGRPLLTVRLSDGSFVQDLSPAQVTIVR